MRRCHASGPTCDDSLLSQTWAESGLGQGRKASLGDVLTHSWFPAVPSAQKALMDTADLVSVAGALEKGDTAWECEGITQDRSDLGFHAMQSFPP